MPGAAPLLGAEGRGAGAVPEGGAALLALPAASPEACWEVGMAVPAGVLVAGGVLLRKWSLGALRQGERGRVSERLSSAPERCAAPPSPQPAQANPPPGPPAPHLVPAQALPARRRHRLQGPGMAAHLPPAQQGARLQVAASHGGQEGPPDSPAMVTLRSRSASSWCSLSSCCLWGGRRGSRRSAPGLAPPTSTTCHSLVGRRLWQKGAQDPGHGKATHCGGRGNSVWGRSTEVPGSGMEVAGGREGGGGVQG